MTTTKTCKLPLRPLLPRPLPRNGIGPHPLRGHLFGFLNAPDGACDALHEKCRMWPLRLYDSDGKRRDAATLVKEWEFLRGGDCVFVPDLRTPDDLELIEGMGGLAFYGEDAAWTVFHMLWLELSDD